MKRTCVVTTTAVFPTLPPREVYVYQFMQNLINITTFYLLFLVSFYLLGLSRRRRERVWRQQRPLFAPLPALLPQLCLCLSHGPGAQGWPQLLQAAQQVPHLRGPELPGEDIHGHHPVVGRWSGGAW